MSSARVARLGQFVGDVGIGADQGRHELVERQPLRLVVLELVGVARILGAEVVQVGRRCPSAPPPARTAP